MVTRTHVHCDLCERVGIFPFRVARVSCPHTVRSARRVRNACVRASYIAAVVYVCECFRVRACVAAAVVPSGSVDGGGGGGKESMQRSRDGRDPIAARGTLQTAFRSRGATYVQRPQPPSSTILTSVSYHINTILNKFYLRKLSVSTKISKYENSRVPTPRRRSNNFSSRHFSRVSRMRTSRHQLKRNVPFYDSSSAISRRKKN